MSGTPPWVSLPASSAEELEARVTELAEAFAAALSDATADEALDGKDGKTIFLTSAGVRKAFARTAQAMREASARAQEVPPGNAAAAEFVNILRIAGSLDPELPVPDSGVGSGGEPPE
jgi:hypothetical protein